MSMSHHGEESGALKRFIAELDGTAVREFPHGRAGADDDGAFAYALATDVTHGMIRMQFPKPIEWIGLDLQAAEQLRDELTARMPELRGTTVIQ